MGLSLTVLGCSGSYPGPGVAASSYLVRSDEATLLVDAGPGSLTNLQRHVALTDLDAVLITHAHLDHWLDLMAVQTALRYYLGGRPLPVHGTDETHRLATGLRCGRLEPTFVWTTIDESARFSVGDLDLRFSRTDHPVETLAVRVDADGRSLVYSADTGAAWSLAGLGPGIDLALVEATLPIDQEGTVQHLSGRQAGAMASEAEVARLVVTHVNPTADPVQHRADAASTYGGPIELAAIDERYQV